MILALLLSWMTVFTAAADAKELNNDLIIVNKKTNKLAYFKNGILEKEFSVATGKTPKLTPEGSFKIANKIKNRPYYKDKIPGGDPRNPLGDRWMGLDVNGTKGSTYGIHGNNNKKSIGKYVSAGCIRMNNDEIHWLFSQVQINTIAIITSSNLSFAEIAEKHGYSTGLNKFDGTLVINGEQVKLEEKLMMMSGRIYIPMRACFELLGGNVLWNSKTGTVQINIGDRTITHKALSDKAVVNEKLIDMTASLYQGNTLMLPLRNISEISGFTVKWDSTTSTVYISSIK